MVAALLLVGCGSAREDDDAGDSGIVGPGVDSGASSGEGDGGGDDGGMMGERLDVGDGQAGTGGQPCQEGEECNECVAYEHTPCDDGTTDLFKAMGLNCPGEPEVTVTTNGSPLAIGVRTGFGAGANWGPQEGSSYGVIGSGIINDLDSPTPTNGLLEDQNPTHCNDDLDNLPPNEVGPLDPGTTLPDPLSATNVGGDCAMDPGLVGTGDCSNTVAGQFSQAANGAFDYTEVALETSIGGENTSISYDFAFFSTEYPFYYGDPFNDMYVGWLESESWTGNVSFDEMGNPISLNAGFLDFRDDNGTTVPDFAGTCMKRHAGTKWLTTTAPVTPGEDVKLILAIFDLQDSILDSYVFLDNFQLGCVPGEKPTTEPVG